MNAYEASEIAFIAYQQEVAAEMKARADAGICTRCNGKGTIRGFGHIKGGKCFGCKGSGKRRVCK